MSSIFPLVALIALSPFAIAVGFFYCAYRGGVYVLGVFVDLVAAASVGKNGREIVD